MSFPVPEPAVDVVEPLAPEAPPPSNPILAFPNGDDFVSSCANSSSPICYNTSISGANIITNLWFSSILGLICYLMFVAFRGKFRLYQARLNMPTVVHKPPNLKLKGLCRWWSWLIPVFKVSDEELLKSAGMDALIAVRVLSFGIMVLFPITLAAMAILIPINYTDNYYKKSASTAGIEDEYSTVFIRLTMSNITPGSSVLWVHFLFVYGAVFWTCWLITEQYKEYISLRQAYVIRNTEATSAHIGGSAEAFEQDRQPLITSRGSNVSINNSDESKPWAKTVDSEDEDDQTPLRADVDKVTPRRGSLDFINETKHESLREKHTPLRILHEDSFRKNSLGNRSVSFNFNVAVMEPDGSPIDPECSTDLSGCSTFEDSDAGGTISDTCTSVEASVPDSAERRVTISESWVDHDFSVDVGSPVGTDGPSVSRKSAIFNEMEIIEEPLVRPKRHNHTRMNSAAVFAALDSGNDASAATALAKIRHHRAASGASTLSATSVTPTKSPRESPKKAESPSMQQIAEKKATPLGLSEIITVVAAERDSHLGDGAYRGETELTTALALHPSICDPVGQQGIAHHWWSYMAEAGSGKIKSEKDKMKAFVDTDVNITQVQGGFEDDKGDSVTVNASLYTVLVTDEPIEKLRLKKPINKAREFWHVHRMKHKQTKISSCSDVGMKLGKSKKTQINAVASNDLEVGTLDQQLDSVQDDEAVDDSSREMTSKTASERGIGVTSGWSATIKNLVEWWRHRGTYREWRRDVRWAMFHRRARIATKMFTELFGDDFDGLIPIYPTKSVDDLIQKWDKACAKLERAQYDLQVLVDKELARRDMLRGSHQKDGSKCLDMCRGNLCNETKQGEKKLERYNKRLVQLKKKIVDLNAETFRLQERIAEEREAVLSDLPSTCFFATFKSQEAAAIASQANLNPIRQRLLNVQPAPSPDDVNWPALTRSWWQRQSRPILVLPLILFIMLLPIGAFTGAFAQLTIAVCGSPTDKESTSSSWYCSDDPWANFFRNLVTSLAPTLLLSLYHMCILPVLVYYAAQAEGQYFSLSSLDRRCCSLFYYWDVFNVFLGAMLGGSVIAELPTYIQQPSKIWNALSAAIPASSNFFINYVAYRALVMAWFRLFYPHMGTTVAMLKWMHILPWAKSPREKALESPIRNCRYGRDIGIPVLMNFVMVLAYCVVSPLILPFGVLYFVFLWAVWRYQMLYVYQRQYESGGQFWPLVAHRVVGCLFICVLFTSVVLILKEAYTQAALMLVSLPLYLLRFDMYISNRYDAVVAQVPLMAVHKAGRVESVDPDIWTPPPLRLGAEGWNPQWGLCWTFWGVPRYTL